MRVNRQTNPKNFSFKVKSCLILKIEYIHIERFKDYFPRSGQLYFMPNSYGKTAFS